MMSRRLLARSKRLLEVLIKFSKGGAQGIATFDL
jgi:hypothetical protein